MYKWKNVTDLSPAGQTAAMNHQISSDKTYQMQTDSVYAPCVLFFLAQVRPPCPNNKTVNNMQDFIYYTWV